MCSTKIIRTDTYPRDIIYPSQAKVVAAHNPASVSPLSVDSIPYLREQLETPENRIRVIILWCVVSSLAVDLI